MSVGGPPAGIAHLHQAGLARARAAQTGEREDLDAAVAISRSALRVLSESTEARLRAAALDGLCGALTERAARLGSLQDLDEAEIVGRQAIALGLDDAWMNLATALAVRFRHTGLQADAEKAVAAGRAALDTVAPGDADLADHLSNMALLLTDLHRRFGTGLDEAVALQKRAVAAAVDDTQRRRALVNLSAALVGQPHAVEAARAALALTPAGHPDRVAVLANLGSALIARMEIDEAIVVLRMAVRAAAPLSPEWSTGLANLGVVLFDRFLRHGARADVDEAATATMLAARAAVPADRPRHLSHLCSVLRARFEAFHDPADLQESLAVGQLAVASAPDDHPERPGYLLNLVGSALLLLEHDPANADGAEVERVARASVSDAGSPAVRAAALSQLAQVLWLRGSTDESLLRARESVALVPSDDPAWARYASNLASLIDSTKGESEEPAQLWRAAARSVAASAEVRLAALHALARREAVRKGLGRAHALYREAVGELLPPLVWRGISAADQRRLLRQHAVHLAVDAAACALAETDCGSAVEVLEQGRGVLWAQALDDRRALDDLARIGGDLAERLARTRAALDASISP